MHRRTHSGKRIFRHILSCLLVAVILVCSLPQEHLTARAKTADTEYDWSDPAENLRRLMKESEARKPVPYTQTAGNLFPEDKELLTNTLKQFRTDEELRKSAHMSTEDAIIGGALLPRVENGAQYCFRWIEDGFKNCSIRDMNNLNHLYDNSANMSEEAFKAAEQRMYEAWMGERSLLTKGKIAVQMGRFGARLLLYGASAYLNGYAAVQGLNDMGEMYYDPDKGFRQTTTSGRWLEGISLGVATGFATYGCMAAVAGIFGFTWPLSVPLALGVALFAAFFHSETGAKFVNGFWELMDIYWQEIKFLTELAWHGTKELAKWTKDKAIGFYEDRKEAFIDFSDRLDRYRNQKLEDLSNFLDLLYNKATFLVRQPFGTGAYKPNIYIYADAPTDVTVTFADPYLLRDVDPVYDGSWQVAAEGDGTLTQADGSPLGYLFYESETQAHYFQTEEGFLIEADDRASRYEEILKAYGFNETEIADFTDFWVDKLPAGVDYMMYPQGTETVDMAMPVEISPAPDHLTRIWFAFEAYEGQDYKEAVPEAITHDGYSVIEWGGVILDEQICCN